jgi:hypothetical protein
MRGCDLDQVNVVPNDKGTFLNLLFTNAHVDVSVACTDSPLLKLDHHHRAYEIEMRVYRCKFEAIRKVEISVICSGWLTVRLL